MLVETCGWGFLVFLEDGESLLLYGLPGYSLFVMRDEKNFTKFYFVYFGVVRRGEFKKKK